MKLSVLNACLLASLALSLNLTGCGTSSDQPQLGTVTGQITFEGKPLTGVSVRFLPQGGRPALGVTNEEGNYELTYIRNLKGSKVGPNSVEIAEDSEMEDNIDAEGDEFVQLTTKAEKPKIPARYNSKTELSVVVAPGPNRFDFALTK